MDYDGFRQMVLGANLKPIKKGSIEQVYKGMANAGNINSHATYNHIINFQNESQYGELGFDEEIVRRTLELSKTDELQAPDNCEVFNKFVRTKLKEPMQRYTYMRLIDLGHYEQIFTSVEFDCELLLCMIDTFDKQVLQNEKFNIKEEQMFIAKILTIIATKSQKFDFVLDFLEDKDREKIVGVLKALDKIADEQETVASLNEAF